MKAMMGGATKLHSLRQYEYEQLPVGVGRKKLRVCLDDGKGEERWRNLSTLVDRQEKWED
jgi:hypothetical protein